MATLSSQPSPIRWQETNRYLEICIPCKLIIPLSDFIAKTNRGLPEDFCLSAILFELEGKASSIARGLDNSMEVNQSTSMHQCQNVSLQISFCPCVVRSPLHRWTLGGDFIHLRVM